jgi:hypothetical protein
MTPLLEPARAHHHHDKDKDTWRLCARVAVDVPFLGVTLKSGTTLADIFPTEASATEAASRFQKRWEAAGVLLGWRA